MNGGPPMGHDSAVACATPRSNTRMALRYVGTFLDKEGSASICVQKSGPPIGLSSFLLQPDVRPESTLSIALRRKQHQAYGYRAGMMVDRTQARLRSPHRLIRLWDGNRDVKLSVGCWVVRATPLFVPRGVDNGGPDLR